MRVLLATRRCVVDTRTKAINQLKALIVSAQPALRERLRHRCTAQQVRFGSTPPTASSIR